MAALDDEVFRKMSMAIPNLNQVTGLAKEATDREHNMTHWEAVRSYPKAICFSLIMSLAIRFGHQLPDGSYQVSSPCQSGLQNGAAVREIMGLLAAGQLADRFGYKPVILGALIMVIACIFLLFFAQSIGMLFAGEVLCGLPWGAFQTLTTTYAADVTPIKLRPILTTYVNLCWVIGQFISAGVLRGILNRPDQWAWRRPYAVQWVWPVPIIIGMIFAPESPWWLVRKGRLEQARRSLRRLTSSIVTDDQLDNTLSMMVLTNEHERQVTQGTTYLDCFKGTNLRRTEIACATWVIQVWTGIWFGGNVTYFLEQAGFDPSKAFDFSLGTNALAFCGTVASWWLMPRLGRRTLYLYGLATMFTILLTVGFMGIPHISDDLPYASGTFLMLFVFTYDLTVGPVCYCLVSEIPSTRLRVKTVVLARNAYNVASIVANFLNPPILNPTAWNLRGKGGFVWAGFCAVSTIWCFFRLPEPKGLAPAEIDVLFEQKVSARKFRKVYADPFRSTNLDVVDMVEPEVQGKGY
ncbi:putative maltose permease [Exophiala viscosa]|uniref:putative maltose permease n=1 Tax=Exophiala viscosa TaxID=2486360 RepID=UPI00219656D5|nr:putative maltose permease [Exophiala viscosa]